MMADRSDTRLFSPVLIAGCLILMTGFAIRASFGIFQIPIAEQFGWLRAEFSFAIAIQNLAWGVGQPLFGALAEKVGDKKAIVLGALVYALGLVLSSFAVTPQAHQFYEVLVGFGIAGTGFGVILAVVGRAASDENRSLALGIATAAGSAGQIVGPPLADSLLQVMPWSSVFIVFAGGILAVLLVLPMLGKEIKVAPNPQEESLSEVLRTALKDPTFTLIFLGFFSCGFQLAFITAHFPAYVTEVCAAIPPNSVIRSLGVNTTSGLGAFSIALIGAANIAGTIAAGALGKHFSKKYLLALIYTGRTIIAAGFILLPMTPTTVVVFSVTMGALWLATVPLTSGLVAQIYGLRYMGTLYGIVFFSHQLGSFLGVWLGGNLYDRFGSYDVVWWVGVGVGAFSALVHLPVRETPRVRLETA
ncbi:MFS transporter [Magnetospira sp. QH-2]|uniref:MFS transporter n=1 Tax=Magnetospira sp. (strain QH-2) TaxID=1288970 RepID=UPI0003E80FD8|nr:MFS transporter [Magnetospira sp. QH-2]CCQ74732.1 putative transmembrane transporter, major facilitator family protein [Magnetospira sp. QH-2]